MNISIKLNEEELSIILQALSHFMWSNPHITKEKFELANKVSDKISEGIEYA